MSKHTERIGVVVVGGGAAGLVAAIMAARNGAKVLILEHNEVPGKKILATGNGKCNYTNKVQGVDKYYGQNPAFVAPVFEQFGLEETLQFFKELGIYPKERNGGYYPQSEQATAIRDVLLMELKKHNPVTTMNNETQNGKIHTNRCSIHGKYIKLFLFAISDF